MARLMRLAGFGAAGASGVLPNLAVMWLLVDHLHVHYLPAAVAATEVAICWNFALVDLLVFRAHRERHWSARFVRFVLLNNLDLAVRLPLLAALVSWWGADELLANLATLLVAFVLRFGITDRFIYRASPPGIPVPAPAPVSGPAVAPVSGSVPGSVSGPVPGSVPGLVPGPVPVSVAVAMADPAT